MGEERRESAEELQQHWDAMRRLGQAAPGTGPTREYVDVREDGTPITTGLLEAHPAPVPEEWQ